MIANPKGYEMERVKNTKPFTLANLNYLFQKKKLWLNPTYQREVT